MNDTQAEAFLQARHGGELTCRHHLLECMAPLQKSRHSQDMMGQLTGSRTGPARGSKNVSPGEQTPQTRDGAGQDLNYCISEWLLGNVVSA